MNILYSIFLGVVQGLTEFLPVSSSGHIVLFQKIFGISEGAMAFNIAVHIATLVAVFFIFWKEIWYMIRHPFSKITLLVITATIPTAIVGFAFRDFFEYAFASGQFIGISFITTGVILLLADKFHSQTHYGKDLDNVSYMDAILVGVAQCVAVMPAISRSGVTIFAGLFRGLKKESAIKFSFLMSVPAILGPAIVDAQNLTTEMFYSIGALPIFFGMITAGVTGYFSIRFMLDLFSRASFKGFAYYVFILGALILTDQFFFGIFF